jgi:acyl-coenzyme A thioesterase PaaI-like protein
MSLASPDFSADGLNPDDFVQMIAQLRRVQESLVMARPDATAMADITQRLAAIAQDMAAFAVDEDKRVSGRLWDVPGRGQAFVPPITITHASDDVRTGRVPFSPVHLGAGGVVNGGVIPLVFVDMLGLFSSSGGRPFSRMAYINVDFKAPIYVGTEVSIEARLLRIEGRKIFIGGRLFEGETEFASAEALFVMPRS